MAAKNIISLISVYFLVGSNIFLSTVVQQRVLISELSLEKMSTSPFTLPSFTPDTNQIPETALPSLFSCKESPFHFLSLDYNRHELARQKNMKKQRDSVKGKC